MNPCWAIEGVGGTQTCGRLAEVGHCRNCPTFMEEGRRLLDRDIPADYRASWTTRVDAAEEKSLRNSVSFLPFSVGGHWLGLRSLLCLKVIEGRVAHRVPFRRHPVFLGLVNVEGEMLPCASLARALGLEEVSAASTDASPRMLVAARGGARWCFPVDETAGIELTAPEQWLPGDDQREGWVLVGDRRVALLNEAHLFDVLERSLVP